MVKTRVEMRMRESHPLCKSPANICREAVCRESFLSSTRASMMSCPTTNWRWSSGFRSSSSTVRQGMYFSSAFFAAPFRVVLS
jgi:hypothetical protein